MHKGYLSELITAAALTNAKSYLVQRCKAIAQKNFPIVQNWVEANEDILTWVPPDGGVLGFPKINDSLSVDSVTLAKRLVDEHGVLISPGEYFGHGGYFRLTFMNPEDELNTGLGAIAEAIHEFV
jgi:aspartate/methionine/tyrosine aminotransferase